MTITGIPADLNAALRSKTDAELRAAKTNLSQMIWEGSVAGLVAEGDVSQYRAMEAAIECEIENRKRL